MKSAYLILLCSAVVVIALFTGCGKRADMRKGLLTIVFYGDSVTRGYGVNSSTESFYGRIENVMKAGVYDDVRTFNAGVSGNDTSEALGRLDDVKAFNPDIVVIAFGLNDCQNDLIDTEEFRQNLVKMIFSFPKETKIVLATSNSFMETGQELWKNLNKSLELYMDEIRKLAREKGYPLIDVHSAWKDQLRHDSLHTESMYVDPTHPSAKGHELIYDTYMNVLRKLIVL